MEESNRRKSWLDLMEEEDIPDKPSLLNEKLNKIEMEPVKEELKMEVVKSEPLDDLDMDVVFEPTSVDVRKEPLKVVEEPQVTDLNSLSVKQEPKEETPVIDSTSDSIKREGKGEEAKLGVDGAESGWANLVPKLNEPSTLTPGKMTFAQICAKSYSPVIEIKSEPKVESHCSTHESFASPEKKDRKRALFADGPTAKESFGILDEKNMDSPSKDIREIMTNIHMDSPLKKDVKQDENEDTTRRSSPRKAVLLKTRDLRELLKSPNKHDSSRKRTREKSKSQDSPATKIPHISKSPSVSKRSPRVHVKKMQYETDPETLARRQKQVDYGKNTIGYQRYLELVPKEKREKRHPKTPPRHLRYSRRAWDGLVKVWRQKLHFWDPPKNGEETPTELPESWDNLSDYSTSMSDTTSERSESVPNTPKSVRKSECTRPNSQCDSEVEIKEEVV